MNKKNLGLSAEVYAQVTGFDSDWRDLWWNQDYLELLARRLKLSQARNLLDVGCGAGHWGQRLASLLGDGASVIGVDHEAGFLQKARQRVAGRRGRFNYIQAPAERLPFQNDTFDLATCQTVLIHLPDVVAVLREMLRVVRPGGLVIAAEPNNMVNALVNLLATPAPPFQQTLRQLAFEQTCLRGKIALGQGDSAIGDRLPALFSRLGMMDVRTWTNDRAATLVPPYNDPAERIHLEHVRGLVRDRVSRWGNRDMARRLFIAGGGDESTFDELWALELGAQDRMMEDIAAQRHVWGGGFLMYVVAGRRPAVH